MIKTKIKKVARITMFFLTPFLLISCSESTSSEPQVEKETIPISYEVEIGEASCTDFDLPSNFRTVFLESFIEEYGLQNNQSFQAKLEEIELQRVPCFNKRIIRCNRTCWVSGFNLDLIPEGSNKKTLVTVVYPVYSDGKLRVLVANRATPITESFSE